MHLSIQDRPRRSRAFEVIHAALDAGVTLIDTADVYCLDDSEIGHNERLVAKALESWSGDRDRVIVATKGGVKRPSGRWEMDGRPEHLRAACERSLAALGVERIDLYQLHAPDPKVPLAESVGALADLQREGKIRWVGLSNVSVPQIREAEIGGAGDQRAEPAQPVLPGSVGGRRGGLLRGAGNRVPGVQPHRWRAAQPKVTGAIPSSSPWPRAWASRPTPWCSRGCWPGRQP